TIPTMYTHSLHDALPICGYPRRLQEPATDTDHLSVCQANCQPARGRRKTMQFTIQREALLKPLQLVAGVVERRQTLPVLSNVLLVRSEERRVGKECGYGV